MSAPLIELERVAKSFRIPSEHRATLREHLLALGRRRSFKRLQVLESVSFTLQPGESLGIMGRNGSGKSTLLRIICGIYRADSGRVQVRAPLTPVLELGVGWNPELDAVDNIELIGSVMGLSLRELRRSRDQILGFAELEQFAGLELKHYSSGMASRLAYAVALHAVEQVLVLDEVFAVGDAAFKQRCRERFQELHQSGHSLLLVSHDPSAVAGFCDRALLLDSGRIVAEGSGQQVADAYLELMRRKG